MACQNGHIGIATRLIEHGADVNKHDVKVSSFSNLVGEYYILVCTMLDRCSAFNVGSSKWSC